MYVEFVGSSLVTAFVAAPVPGKRYGRLRMPNIKPEISIGNLLSIAVSTVALFSIVVTLAVFGSKLRADVDRHEMSLADIKTQLEKQNATNQRTSEYMAELRVDLKYMREALQRIEKKQP